MSKGKGLLGKAIEFVSQEELDIKFVSRDVARTFKGGSSLDTNNFMIAMIFLSNFNFTPTDRI